MADTDQDVDARLRSAAQARNAGRTVGGGGGHHTAHSVHRTGTVDTPWNGPAAVAAAPNEAAVLWHMHAWRGEGDPDAKTTYKLPHHAPRAGSPANLPGVRNALARLPQSDIPASERAAVERHLRAHLAEAERGGDRESSD